MATPTPTPTKPSSKNPKLPWRRLAWYALFSGITFLLVSGLMMYAYLIRHRDEPETIGVSFSQYQAEQYKMDWREAFIGTLDDLQFKHYRLAAYWNRIEPAPDRYDFSETDWMLDEAAKRGAKVKLVIGQKLIRVPECFYPDWLNRKNPDLVEERVNKMLATVVNRYKNHPAIEGWQVENEFLLYSFGDCPAANLSNTKLRREIATVREADPSIPITLTQSNQFGFPAIGPHTEYYGFSMYRKVWNKALGYSTYPQRGIYNWWKAATIETYWPTTVTIHELQAEAWGPRGNEALSYEESQKSMSLDQLKDNIAYARETNIKRFDLWGAEWWWAMKQQGHPEYWDYIRSLNAR